MWFGTIFADKNECAPATAICGGSGLVLSRPDQHVAWHGNRPPFDPLALIDYVRGVVIRKAGGDRPNEQRPERGQQR
jgi:hypothetical protein